MEVGKLVMYYNGYIPSLSAFYRRLSSRFCVLVGDYRAVILLRSVSEPVSIWFIDDMTVALTPKPQLPRRRLFAADRRGMKLAKDGGCRAGTPI